MTAKMSDVMAMAGEALARSALVHLHRVGVLFLAVIGQERARASASCVSSSSPALGRSALVHVHRLHCAPTRSYLYIAVIGHLNNVSILPIHLQSK